MPEFLSFNLLSNLNFEWWQAIYVLPLPWIVRFLLPFLLQYKQVTPYAEIRFPDAQRLTQTWQPSFSRNQFTQKLNSILLTLLWFSLVLCLMRPQALEYHTQTLNKGYDLMLAMDTSRSMEALDFTVNNKRVNRLSVIKGVLSRFIEQRKNDRIGLILFGSHAYIQAPLTHDGHAVQLMLMNAVPRMAGDATAIGDAIGLAVKKLRDRPEGSRILILVTDGENTAGILSPMDAAQLAKKYNIRVYTIGVGTQGEVPIMEDDKLIMTEMPIDEALLTKVANLTGGTYNRATNSSALEDIYQDINTLEKTESEVQQIIIPIPIYRYAISLSLALLALLGIVTLIQTKVGQE
jgi:Ca-activated chloride channel homolog